MATFKTKDGRNIQFKVYKRDPYDSLAKSPDTKSQSYELPRIEAYVDGDVAGYIRACWIPKATWDRNFPTVWDYRKHFGGAYRFDTYLKTRDPDDLYRAIQDWRGRGDAFEVPPPKERDKFLRSFTKGYDTEYLKYKDHIVDKPFVDYIRVFDYTGEWGDPILPGMALPLKNWKRNHIALALYKYTAQWLAKQGLPLYASGTQAPEAAAAWKRLRSTRKLKEDGKRIFLDYRKAALRVAKRYMESLSG